MVPVCDIKKNVAEKKKICFKDDAGISSPAAINADEDQVTISFKLLPILF